MSTIRTSPSGRKVGAVLNGTIVGPIAPGSFSHVIIPVAGARPDDFMIPSSTNDDAVISFNHSQTNEVHCSVFNFGGDPISNIVVRFQQFV